MRESDFYKMETPAYVFDADALLTRVRRLREILGEKYRIVYAMKANPFLVETLLPVVDGFEVCSPGEERICASLGVPPEKLILSGVNKEEANFEDIVRRCKSAPVYTVESEQQMHMLDAVARRNGLKLRVLLRLTGGNQFGMDKDTVRRLFLTHAEYPGLSPEGIQYYSGTQKKMKAIPKETALLDQTAASIQEDLGENAGILSEIEYGPGLPVSYFLTDNLPEDAETAGLLRESLEEMRFDGQITLEIGRFIAAACGYYLTAVKDLKISDGNGYCIVDGGIHQVNYFGQMMGMKVPHISVLKGKKNLPESGADPAWNGNVHLETSDAAKAEVSDPAGEQQAHWMVCGSLCTTADVLVRDFPFADLKAGDILVFERAGAYSVTEGISLFLSRDLPRVYLYREGEILPLREQILTEEWNYGKTDQHT